MRIFDIFRENERGPTNEPKLTSATTNEPESKSNPIDKITMDVPLLLRVMEYSREDAQNDMDLHHIVEKLVDLSAKNQSLTMDHYNDIINSIQERFNLPKHLYNRRNRFKSLRRETEGDSPAEKLIKDIEYHPKNDDKDEEEKVKEGHGRYWCSTDKRWKERKGPKQSRN